MKYSLHLELEGLPTMSNLKSGRSHWRYADNERKRWQQLVWASIGTRRPKEPLKQFHLTLTRFSSTMPDYDGLVRGFKSIVDGLKRAGVIQDDKLSNTGAWDCRWIKVPPKKGKVQVIVNEIAKS